MAGWFFLLAAVIGGISNADVIVANDTGIPIARLEIDGLKVERNPAMPHQDGRIVVSATPTKHNLRITFVGGAEVKWPHLDFNGIHEIFIQRGNQNNFEVRVQ